MTKQEMGKLAIELLQAELDGKQLQYTKKGYNFWRDVQRIDDYRMRTASFCFDIYDFRIKPEKKLVPFTWEDRDFLRDKWIKHKNSNSEIKIVNIYDSYVNELIGYIELFDEWIFLDGSPCGKEVEE